MEANIMETTAKYTMRKLNATDIAPMASIISKIGVKEFAGAFSHSGIEENGEDAVKQIGMAAAFEVAGIILTNLPKCMNEVFSLVGSLIGKDVKEIEELDIDVFFEVLVEIFQKEELKKVFKHASKLLS